MRRRSAVSIVLTSALLSSKRADAYRPFDGTDADVTKPHMFELELGPVQYLREGDHNFLETPNLVLNYGVVPRLELVIDAESDVAVGPRGDGNPRYRFVGDDVLAKYVLREGMLQEKTGPSIATEGGVLVPEYHGDAAFGGSLDVITSFRCSWASLHWNEWFEYTREAHADLFSGIIAEGPHDWTVRPVAEAFYDKDFVAGETASLLLGAIWTLNDSLSFDAAVRGARTDDEYDAEVRLGLTWSVTIGGGESSSTQGRALPTNGISRYPESR